MHVRTRCAGPNDTIGHSKPLSIGIIGLAAVMLSGCAASPSDASAPYFPKTRVVASAPAQVAASSASSTSLPPPASRGPVPLPNAKLTPGAVTPIDTAGVCKQARQAKTVVPNGFQQAIFAEYKLSWVLDRGAYFVNYLVPLDLGGAPVIANLWPITLRGLALHDKSQLDVLLRDAVCQGRITLTDAQSGLESDWYTLWLRFGH